MYLLHILCVFLSDPDRKGLQGAEEDSRIYGPAEESSNVLHLAFTEPTSHGSARIFDFVELWHFLVSIFDSCGYLYNCAGKPRWNISIGTPFNLSIPAVTEVVRGTEVERSDS